MNNVCIENNTFGILFIIILLFGVFLFNTAYNVGEEQGKTQGKNDAKNIYYDSGYEDGHYDACQDYSVECR